MTEVVFEKPLCEFNSMAVAAAARSLQRSDFSGKSQLCAAREFGLRLEAHFFFIFRKCRIETRSLFIYFFRLGICLTNDIFLISHIFAT